MHAREADHLILLRKSISSYGKPIWDTELADSLQKMINTGHCNMFIVIHEMGGHFEYTKLILRSLINSGPREKAKISLRQTPLIKPC